MPHRTGADLVAEAKRQIREVTPEEVIAARSASDGTIYLDVREPNEWNLGHLPGAIHIPRGTLEGKVEAAIDRSRPVVIYCASGNRSALAAVTMMQMGYENVASMARGIQGWAALGGEIEE